MKHSAELRLLCLGPYIDRGSSAWRRSAICLESTEKAYDDCVLPSQARLLDNRRLPALLPRAQSYKNIFDTESGFVRPRTNGSWFSPFDPREVNFSFTEANSGNTVFVPQDIMV